VFIADFLTGCNGRSASQLASPAGQLRGNGTIRASAAASPALGGANHHKLSAWDVVYSLNMAIASLITYWIITSLLSEFVDPGLRLPGRDVGRRCRRFRLQGYPCPCAVCGNGAAYRNLRHGCSNFRRFLIEGTKPNLKKIKEYVDRSLMLVTALSPVIGYDKASKIAHYAMDNDLNLKEAALKLGFVTEEVFDRVVDPVKMVKPYVAENINK
jgi:hypothetical protein